MRGSIGGTPSSAEARHRLPVTVEEPNKRKTFRIKSAHRSLFQYRNWNSRFSTLKFILVIVVLGGLYTLFHSPSVYNTDHPSDYASRPSLADLWTRETPHVDHRYASSLDIDWAQISVVTESLTGTNAYQGIGILNFNNSEINHWKELIPDAEHVILHLDPVSKNTTWNSLYPEWIDEEEDYEFPVCPSLPKLKVPGKPRIDLVAVKLPCNKSGDWLRDVARLHLQLAVADLAAFAKGYHPLFVLLVTDCFPTPNLFSYNELVEHGSSVWLYEPNLHRLKEMIQLPVGSCELAIPLRAKENTYSGNPKREAYATILHSAHVYVCGAIVAAQSIRMAGSTRDLVILVDDTISSYHREGLEAAGWKIRTIERIRNPKAERDAYNEWNYSKFRLWQLTDYDKIIFIDADLLIQRNMDFLFQMPEISATGNNGSLFNSGVMVIEPSNYTFELLMDHINEIESYNGGDQGYLNEIFTWWHRIPKYMNFLKHFWEGDEEEKKAVKTSLFGADPPVLYVIHYLGLKPWLCFRDYDCNWNVDILHEFASDVAHKTWWKVHDAMPENLHKYCLLRSKQKASLEWDRRQAEKGNYTDGHWKVEIQDPRLKICFEDFCYWESMLWHWGETNWTDATAIAPPPPSPPVLPLPA
ncbi:putative UDP-glucuronate:xylan alpha-glucuronosyltransferase 3 [Impatiens glandulifera]|uniref:putative UDP-glucuronate:xylan alpha-glucuronosyltransferase 3 n=1 Tax=Impatiens glandulifera TaxID=253017 RepID=UPI001FB0856E|nr:putative UDP-glucuronate:xylan alpha-glucuronosyltransferase 3 [Impatiens glandulifera]XP_047307133.1 putative UDP-glucuronate:xylan alpha-glucuronosyltransferase 3 [Impatiens glandulifera]